MRISLTTPDGRVFEVVPSKIDALVDAIPDVWAEGTRTIVFYGIPTFQQGVRETIEMIKKLEESNEEKISIHRSSKSAH